MWHVWDHEMCDLPVVPNQGPSPQRGPRSPWPTWVSRLMFFQSIPCGSQTEVPFAKVSSKQWTQRPEMRMPCLGMKTMV